MTYTDIELLNLAVNRLRETTEKLLTIAQCPTYSNENTPELKELNEEMIERFRNCMILKAVFQTITKGKSIGQ